LESAALARRSSVSPRKEISLQFDVEVVFDGEEGVLQREVRFPARMSSCTQSRFS
jgi:hypothetical protein